jgi:hypothetical protein
MSNYNLTDYERKKGSQIIKSFFTDEEEKSKRDFFIKERLVYEARMYISYKCTHCINFTGMVYGVGLTSLFSRNCVLKRVLLKNNWDLSKLQIKKNWQYNEKKESLELGEIGLAILERHYSPITELDNLKKELLKNFDRKITKKIQKMTEILDSKVNICTERIQFFEISKSTHYLYSTYENAVPILQTPFTLSESGEFGFYMKR